VCDLPFGTRGVQKRAETSPVAGGKGGGTLTGSCPGTSCEEEKGKGQNSKSKKQLRMPKRESAIEDMGKKRGLKTYISGIGGRRGQSVPVRRKEYQKTNNGEEEREKIRLRSPHTGNGEKRKKRSREEKERSLFRSKKRRY